MRDSLFYSSIRSFFVALFGMIGIGFGIIPLFIILIALFSVTGGDQKAKSEYSFEVVPNAVGSRKVLSKDAPVILKLNITSVIGTEKLNMQVVRDQLTESREGIYKKDRVKALLLNINTPGGTVVDSDGIYRAILAYKERYKVPVFAFVDGLCASGGMYVASAADKVYASDVSLIGSVGVLSPSFMNFVGLMEKVGVSALTISAGKGKDDLNPLRKWRPDESDSFRKIIDYFYDHFVNIVVEGRPEVSRSKLVDEYGAKVFPATKAKEIGFVDGDVP